jgi:chromosome segregation ATPase
MTTTPTPTPAPTPEPCKKNDPVFLTDAPTPLTDAVSKEIGSLACRWKTGDIDAVQFEKAAQQEMDKIATLERELTSAQAALAAKDREIDALNRAVDLNRNNWRTDSEEKDREIARLQMQLDATVCAEQHRQVVTRAEKAEAELAALKERAEQSYTDRSFELLNMTARAQRAEAERDVLREACAVEQRAKAQLRAEAEGIRHTANRYEQRLAEARRERDTAEAERDQLRAEVEALKAENRGMLQAGGYDYLCQQRDEAERRAAKYLATGEAIQKQLGAAQQDKERLLCALNDATTSLCTLAQQSGRTEEMRELSQIRGYAFSRYSAAIDAARAGEAAP